MTFEACLVASTQTCSECCRRTLNQKEQLRYHAVSLRQHGSLVKKTVTVFIMRVGHEINRIMNDGIRAYSVG